MATTAVLKYKTSLRLLLLFFLVMELLSTKIAVLLRSRQGNTTDMSYIFVSDLLQVGGVLRFPPQIKLTATIY